MIFSSIYFIVNIAGDWRRFPLRDTDVLSSYLNKVEQPSL